MIDAVLLNTPTPTTVPSAMRLDWQFTCCTFQGGKKPLSGVFTRGSAALLKEGDIIVMDNPRAHHTRGVEKLLRSVGTVPLYLPPYSPDFNPIEKMWSKMNAILRKLRVRSQDLLDNAARQTLSCVSASNCEGWFQCAGF